MLMIKYNKFYDTGKSFDFLLISGGKTDKKEDRECS